MLAYQTFLVTVVTIVRCKDDKVWLWYRYP